jgi:hypothetical protein
MKNSGIAGCVEKFYSEKTLRAVGSVSDLRRARTAPTAEALAECRCCGISFELILRSQK